ncbi:MAG: hypothetical protein HYT80_06500 [Euryarchaeota archaeon]|nr:hypothetical protein [Euryarchaeota archaeon]
MGTRNPTMAAGQFVFPLVILGFLGYMGSFLVSTPAAEPIVPIGERTMRVEPGDRVTVELTAFYGAPGESFVFYTTQEERVANLPRGRIEPGYDPVLTFNVPLEGRGAYDLSNLVIGHRTGDAFTSPVIPPSASLVGDWEERKTIPRAPTTFPVEERQDGSRVVNGFSFNATQYADRMRELGYDLAPGLVWPCEADLWQCRLVSIDYEANLLVFERVVENGMKFPMTELMRASEVRGEADWDITVVDATADTFKIRLDPPVGNRFQLRDHLTPDLRTGTYEVLTVDDASIEVNYTTAANTHAELVGQPTYYDIVVVRIERPEAR